MAKSYQICCPKCNNHQNFYRYGKDRHGNQKYLCRVCGYQFAPDAHAAGKPGRPRIRSYPTCPVCGKAMFLHHDHKYYSDYRCCDKKCNHSIFVPKPAAISAPSMSELSGKNDFKRMRYPVHIILMALSMFYMGKNSFRNIALILRAVMNIRVSHTTISNWCTKFAPLFQNIALELAIDQYLPENDKLKPGMFYRHDSVYIVDQELEHTGLPYEKLPEYMSKFVTFINAESTMNDLLKAVVIHFYIAYLHPYFDGNGRIARLVYLWYLQRQGYSSALFILFSSYIEQSQKEYYSAYSLAEGNAKISGVMDVTAFLLH